MALLARRPASTQATDCIPVHVCLTCLTNCTIAWASSSVLKAAASGHGLCKSACSPLQILSQLLRIMMLLFEEKCERKRPKSSKQKELANAEAGHASQQAGSQAGTGSSPQAECAAAAAAAHSSPLPPSAPALPPPLEGATSVGLSSTRVFLPKMSSSAVTRPPCASTTLPPKSAKLPPTTAI